MSDQRPEKLIDDIISFINYERELFGDFGIKSSSISVDTHKTHASSKQSREQDKNKASEPTPQFSSNQFSGIKKSASMKGQIKQCNTLGELETLCRGTDNLKTDLEGTQLVFGVGNPGADLMLIGEAPGAEEDKQGEPFVGAAGQLLNKILAAVNFKREDVYIANILKHRPPNNRNPRPEERERSLPFLLQQIDLIRPILILSLGKISAQTLLDRKDSLGKMRGHFHPFREKYELLATYHPAALLRHSKWKRPTWEDMQLLRKRYDELGCKP